MEIKRSQVEDSRLAMSPAAECRRYSDVAENECNYKHSSQRSMKHHHKDLSNIQACATPTIRDPEASQKRCSLRQHLYSLYYYITRLSTGPEALQFSKFKEQILRRRRRETRTRGTSYRACVIYSLQSTQFILKEQYRLFITSSPGPLLFRCVLKF